MYTEDKIQGLLKCPKRILEAPKNIGWVRGSSKREFIVVSLDNQHFFKCFISANETLPENFSIGLIYDDKEERDRICLLRCNGRHGGTRDIPHHSYTHIHTASADDINNGIRVVRKIEETDKYSTIEEAIQFFIEFIELDKIDRAKYFPRPSGFIQTNLFDS